MVWEINEVNPCKLTHIFSEIYSKLSVNARYCIVVNKSISSCHVVNLPKLDMILCPTEQRMCDKTGFISGTIF